MGFIPTLSTRNKQRARVCPLFYLLIYNMTQSKEQYQKLSVPWGLLGDTQPDFFTPMEDREIPIYECCKTCKVYRIEQTYKNGLCEDCQKMQHILKICGRST